MSGPVHYHEGQFPPKTLDWERLVPLIGPANATVARYDGMLAAIPNAHVLLSPLTTHEAVLSSRIEGTQATMGEVLEYEARGETDDPSTAKEADIWEVLSYRKAMRAATERLKELPLCTRIILECHKILLNSVRGHGKSPGQYRKNPQLDRSQGVHHRGSAFCTDCSGKTARSDVALGKIYPRGCPGPFDPIIPSPCG